MTLSYFDPTAQGDIPFEFCRQSYRLNSYSCISLKTNNCDPHFSCFATIHAVTDRQTNLAELCTSTSGQIVFVIYFCQHKCCVNIDVWYRRVLTSWQQQQRHRQADQLRETCHSLFFRRLPRPPQPDHVTYVAAEEVTSSVGTFVRCTSCCGSSIAWRLRSRDCTRLWRISLTKT